MSKKKSKHKFKPLSEATPEELKKAFRMAGLWVTGELMGQTEEGAYSKAFLGEPAVEYCDKEGKLTRKQFDEIVRQAEWEPDVKLKLDSKIPLEDEVYDLIREEVKEPVTLSEIRHRIEKKYETYLSVFEEDGYTGYCYVHSKDKQHSPAKSKDYYPTFNEAMRALILEMGK